MTQQSNWDGDDSTRPSDESNRSRDDAEPTAQLGGPPTEPVQQPPTYSSIHDPDLWSSQEPTMSTPTGDAPAGRTADESTVYTGGPSPAGPTATMSGTTAAGAGDHGTYYAHTHDEVSEEPPKGPRMPTVAWGLVLVLLGLVVIAVGLGIDLQLELVFIGILGLAGLTLLVGALVGAGKRDK